MLRKFKKAAQELNISQLAIAGGVSANSGLRRALQELGEAEGWQTYIPRFEYCTDNAAMITMAAHYKYLNADCCAQTVSPLPRMAF